MMAWLAMAVAMPALAEDAPLLLLPQAPSPEETTPQTTSAAVVQQPPQPVRRTASRVVVRVGQHDTYDRIVFDWPQQVGYRVTRDGRHAVIHFDKPGVAQLAPTTHLTRARNFAAADEANGNLEVSFDIDAQTTLKDFFSGASIAVDIVGRHVQELVAAPAAAAPKEKPKVEAAPAPAPVPPAAPLSPATPPTPATPPPGVSASSAAQALAATLTPVATPAVAENAPTPPIVTAVDKAAPATPPAAPVAFAPAAPGKDIAALISARTPTLVASLDPHTPLRAAIWARGGYGYIVFDRKLTMTADALVANLPAPVVELQPLDLPKSSGFRFRIPDTTEIHATREGSVWKIYLTKQRLDLPVSASLLAQPDFALGARYILPLPDAPDPIHFVDPVVGDNLVLVPLNQTQAFSVWRRMADFQIWPAAQGLVIKPLTDKVLVRSISDGIEITSDSGLHVSPATDTGESQQSAQKARSAMAGKSLFDFSIWRGKSDESFTATRQWLQQTIVDVPDRERDRARLELIRFYFARGYGEEALGLINFLEKDIPDLALHSDFLALSGAAKILANRPEDGLKDFETANLPDQPEVKLWQAVANAQLRNWTEAEDKFASSETLLAGYPEPFYSRFFVLAIESALAVGNNREAADWLDVLQESPHNADVDPAIEYLRGVLHAKSGRAGAASQAWKDVAASNDRLYRVRAEMALIDLGVANNSLTPAQAADRLEALRFAWRGDDLEVDILHRLGQFYIKARNVKAGLSILAEALQLYPHSALAPKIQSEMSDTFRDVFLGDLGKQLSPLDALTLYQQYRGTLMPTGDDGVAVTRNLAERLTAIDLMDQAGDLLEDIATHKLKGEEKGRVAARLAAIRLLDHKPQAALDALDLSAGDTLPATLQRDRSLLRAKALSELHRDEEALAVLKNDTRTPAKILRADINMKSQHWEDAAKNLIDLIGPPPRPGETLREDQADWLVRCAIAMAMAGDQVGLDRLAIDYGAPMAGTQQNNTFRILVEAQKPGQLRDIAAAQSRITEVDMFQGFLDTYRKPESAAGQGQDAKKP